MDRRAFMGGATAFGVGAAWVAPTVVSVAAGGNAELVNSPPPTTTTTSTTTSSTTTSTTTTTTRPTTTTTRPTTTTTRPDDGRSPTDDDNEFPDDDDGARPGGMLPRTGFEFQDLLNGAFGLIAAGGAMKVWSAAIERQEATVADVADVADEQP